MSSINFLFDPKRDYKPGADCAVCHGSGGGCGCHGSKAEEVSDEIKEIKPSRNIETPRPQ